VQGHGASCSYPRAFSPVAGDLWEPNCYDNAMVETVFKTIKSELIWRTSFQSRRQAEHAIARYIDGFYNPVRRHSALGYSGHRTRGLLHPHI